MSKIKLNSDEKIILAFHPLRELLDIFSGPFLTAYFVKISADSLQYLSLYNILVYLMLLIGSFVFGFIMKRNFKLQTLRLGIFCNIVYFFSIIILRENIVSHLPLIAFLLGFSASAYWMPFHSLIGSRVNNDHRTKFTSMCTVAKQVTNVVVPFLLGSLITASNFIVAAIVILIISIFQIMLSFFFDPEPKTVTKSLNYKKLLKITKEDKQTRLMIFSNIFTGLASSGSASKMLIILLIVEYYKTDFNLGVITSISTLISIIIVNLYGKYYHDRSDKLIILVTCLCVVASLVLFIIFKINILLIAFYVLYLASTSLIHLALGIRAYNISDRKILKSLSSEYWSFLELSLNTGRILGYSLLLAVSILSGEHGLLIMLLILTICIPLNGLFVWKIKKYENGF